MVALPRFDLDAFLALPRLLSLHLSPDGSRLALTVQTVAADGKRFAASIWEVGTAGDDPPRRLTRSAKGETARGYLPDGSLLFTSSRPDPESADNGTPDADVLYVLPAGGGEPMRVLAPPAGLGAVLTAARSSTVVVSAAVHPGAATFEEDGAREKARKDAGVEARLVEHYPDRWWDHDIGPRQPHLYALDLSAPGGEPPTPRDLTPSPPWAGWFEDMHFALSPDGGNVAFGAAVHPAGRFKADLAVVETGKSPLLRVVINAAVDHSVMDWSPDGSTIAVASTDLGEPGVAPRFHLSLVDAPTGATKPLAEHWDAQAQELRWTNDGSALVVTADERGQTPVFLVALDGTVTRLTSAGAYSNLTIAPDGTALYAIRSHLNEPPVPVALDITRADQEPRVVSSPMTWEPLPSRVEEISTTAADGSELHGWLVLPQEAATEPLPLVVFIHGGPISSWAGWHWRWNAALLAARGWAVLLPNPRLSTGYGHDHIARAWDDWATLPAADIHATVDAATARPDIDGERVAAMGGSYGGYMSNWMAVTTDRFKAIVTHASVWNMTMERDASDAGFYMDREFGDPLHNRDSWHRQSPHSRSDSLATPMLVIHGARDQRVPLDNAHALWMELQTRGIPSRMLVFPDENHWVLKPQNARLWYETVFAFLDEHVRGQPWQRPGLL